MSLQFLPMRFRCIQECARRRRQHPEDGGACGPQRPGQPGCRRARVRLSWPLAASPHVQEIGVVLGRAEQGQGGLAPAPAVADMLHGRGADRVAPAVKVIFMSCSRGFIHGVGAARHEAAPGKHNVLIT